MRIVSGPVGARQCRALNRMLASGPGKFEGGMTPRKYIAMTKAKYITANRDLVDLVTKQLLVREGAGRSTYYNLTIPGWGWVPKLAVGTLLGVKCHLSGVWLLDEHILDMDESNVWEPSVRGAPRFITFLGVVAVHLAVLALLLGESRIPGTVAAANDPVELMFFPPTKVPKVRFEHARHPSLSADTALSVTLPGLASPTLSPPSAGADGDAPAVNWAAEAHRAVQAAEIRRNHPPGGAISGSTPWTDWWPQGKHHAGDQFKTESGDWIVWISSNCYQLAKWGPGAYGSTPPQTICPHQHDAPRRTASATNSD